MRISQREAILACAVAFTALFGASYLVVEPRWKQIETTDAARLDATDAIAVADRLVQQGPEWDARLDTLRQSLPTYPPDKRVTVDVLRLLDTLRRKHGIVLLRQDAEDETRRGDLYEMAISCSWEGKLDPLVHFLFDLQEQRAMLDVRELTITAKGKGLLKGSFTVYAVYRRTTTNVSSPPPASAPTAAGADPS